MHLHQTVLGELCKLYWSGYVHPYTLSVHVLAVGTSSHGKNARVQYLAIAASPRKTSLRYLYTDIHTEK